MSRRLGAALTGYIRRMSPGAEAKFVLVEGVSLSLAEGMARSWDDELPPLAVVSGEPARFGAHAMTQTSGTALRNRRGQDGARGVVLVLCEGQQVPDRQSLSNFETVAPSMLLEDANGMGLLAQQHPAVLLDGPAHAVRQAVVAAGPAVRPSAAAVAAYLDRLAAGDDPLQALPTLGAFGDPNAGDRVDGDRIGDNLRLAARRTSDELLRRAAYADLRQRAQRVLGRRPGSPDKEAVAEEVMQALQSGDRRLLTLMSFDEAREVFEQKTQTIGAVVAEFLTAYQDGLAKESPFLDLPWESYQASARQLRSGTEQKRAARELLDVDEAQRNAIFDKPTRAKLERLTRDKAISASDPSCPEAALVRATQQLGGKIQRIQVISPAPPSSTGNRSSAVRALTLACARLRLGGLMRKWERSGVEADGLLLRAADYEANLAEAFADADLEHSPGLPALELRLFGPDNATVQVSWKPDLDDAALLRTCLAFSEQSALTLRLPAEPTLRAFCGSEQPAADAVPDSHAELAGHLQSLAAVLLQEGLTPAPLEAWVQTWTQACEAAEAAGDASGAQRLTLAGGVAGGDRAAALTPLAPLKAEWLAQYLQALRDLLTQAEQPDGDHQPSAATAAAIARTTASQHPAHLRLRTRDTALLPTSEGRIWSLYGGEVSHDDSGHADTALTDVLGRLLSLQPEAAGHLRCLAWGPGAADMLTAQAVRIIGTRLGGAVVGKVEIFCVGQEPRDRPSRETLALADTELRGAKDVLELRYLPSLQEAERVLRPGPDSPAVHLALVTGITDAGAKLHINTPEPGLPILDGEVLFAPRTWQRPKTSGQTLLMPPAASAAGRIWLKLQNAVEDSWPDDDTAVRVPEVRTGTMEIAAQLEEVHRLALWVATLDRYATRDSLEQALGGADRVAILHQERRLGGDSPLSLVLSQRSGGPADRAIGRSLRAAGIVAERDTAFDIGRDIRKVASQGYGILALEAATSGAGINELVGHCVAFSLLSTRTTPWPLPPGCRVLLVSLDEYRHWFRSKRADLLAIALDPEEGGVHIAAIEVKARRSDEHDAASGALDQLNQTLAATRWAAYPQTGSVHSRLWLNRITEAAYAVARESRFKLDKEEIAALENFRRGTGTLEWAGVGLVFGPKVEEVHRHYPTNVAGDIVPVALHSIRLTEQLLRDATKVNLTDLKTVEAEAPPLPGGRIKRRPEAKATPDPDTADPEPTADEGIPADAELPSGTDDAARADTGGDVTAVGAAEAAGAVEPPAASSDATAPPAQNSGVDPGVRVASGPGGAGGPGPGGTGASAPGPGTPAAPHTQAASPFKAPLLGWDVASGEPLHWHPAGAGQTVLQNGHVEIWGSSGMGKTQFVMSLLAQLAHHSGSRFGIADFKNDYSSDTGFPELTGAEFIDLWNGGAPYNPLALDDSSDRAIDTAVIELRDVVDEAAAMFGGMGRRQRAKLETFLGQAYQVRKTENRWPTLRTLDSLLDADLAGVMGDLTRHELFKDGPPLGDVVDRNVVFGLSRIPGNGQTTVLAAAFILSSLLQRVQNLPPVPNTVRYVAVVDEAHRVSPFRAVHTMVREGRSKGLAVLLATQQPLDLPDVVAANAQTKICFGLPDASVATMAARKLDPDRPRLAEQIRSLGVGEAFVKFGGQAPVLVKMAQAYRDREALGIPGPTR